MTKTIEDYISERVKLFEEYLNEQVRDLDEKRVQRLSGFLLGSLTEHEKEVRKERDEQTIKTLIEAFGKDQVFTHEDERGKHYIFIPNLIRNQKL